MRPLGHRILVKRILPESKKGSVLLVSNTEKVRTGIVIRTGPGKLDNEGIYLGIDIQEDEKVIFPIYAGTPVSVDDTTDEYLIISADEILAVLED